MGGSHSAFTKEQLEEYQELTYFSKKEILHCYKRFLALDFEKVSQDKDVRLDKDTILSLAELKVNPFNDRICEVFSSEEDCSMNFEDFLDMASVFSDSAPKSVKAEYAFRIYDFDGDDYITSGDLRQLISRLTGDQQLSADEMQQLINDILKEADLDDDDALSFAEFEHVISKAPDFLSSFRIRL